jgi:hypothetical protein
VALNQNVGLVHQSLALGDAGAQILLVLLEFLGLAFPPLPAIFGDGEFLAAP